MPKSSTEADRLEAFVHALVGNMQRHGLPIPDLDLSGIRREANPDAIATAASVIAAHVHDCRNLTLH